MKPDVRLVIPALAVWLVMWVVTGWEWGIWVFTAISIAMMCVMIIRTFQRKSTHPHGVAILVLLVSSVVIGGLRIAVLNCGPVATAARQGQVVHMVVVVHNARVTPQWGTVVIDASVTTVSARDRVWATNQAVVVTASADHAREWMTLQAGTAVRLTARLSPAQWVDGVCALAKALDSPQVVRPPPMWQRAIESMRRGLVDAMVRNPDQQAALVPALVVGDTSAVSSQMKQDFQSTGLTHLMAVSGANLAIMLSFLTALAKRIGVRGRGLTVVSVAGIAVFIALCHSEPSVLRAAGMGVVALVSVGRGMGGSGIRALCLAVICLCWIDPWMSRSFGFALSVLACVGLIGWGSAWASSLSRWLPRWMAEAMAIPLSAQIATQPLVCWLSGSISLAGLLANAIAGPWVAPATVIGLVAAIISPLTSVVSTWAGYIAGWCAEPILVVAHGFARLPGASHPWPTTFIGMTVIVACCLVGAWVMPRILTTVWAVLLATSVMVGLILIPPVTPGWPGSGWRVAMCDVGQGDAMVIRVAKGQAIVMDVGPPDTDVTGCLHRLAVQSIPLLILSHFHADHVGGLSDVLDEFRVSDAVMPGQGAGKQDVVNLLVAHDASVSTAVEGEVITVGDVRATVAAAFGSVLASTDGEESSSENDSSLIVRFDAPEMSILGTGDVEIAGQQGALSHAELLDVDVLKVPHHGSARQDVDFLAATKATIALISVGENNGYGHPAASAVRDLVNDGMEVVRTDEHGSIAVAHDGQWEITATA